MTTYVDALTYGFPGVQFQCTGDPTVYENITHLGGSAMPSQEALDTWIAANPEPSGVRLTKYEFRKLFTLNERVAIDAAPTNTAIPANYRAMLQTMNRDMELSGEVHLSTNSDVAAGVNFLEQLGLIAAGRAAQILANQPPPA